MADAAQATPAARGPLAAERHAHLLLTLDNAGSVRVSQAAAELGVNPITVRRDIAVLERQGRLRRVRGGAVCLPAPASGGATAAPRPEDAAPAPGATGPASPVSGNTAASGSLGVLVPSLDYYWPGIVGAMETAAVEHGWTVVLRGSSYSAQDERPILERLVEADGVRGLLLAPRVDGPHADNVLQWLERSAVPAVLVEREAAHRAPDSMIDTVCSDHSLGSALAAQHLAALGHRRIGLVLTSESVTSTKIAAGWHAECRRLGLSEPGELLTPRRETPGFAQAIEAVVESALSTGLTALLVHSDPEAFAVVQHAEERGLKVPGELSVIAYDDEVAHLYSPALTAVRPPRAEVGRAAVELVRRRIAAPSRPAHRLFITPTLQSRSSTGPVTTTAPPQAPPAAVQHRTATPPSGRGTP